MKLIELVIIEEIERIQSRNRSMDSVNHFIMYDDMISSVKEIGGFWGLIITKVFEEKFFERHYWLSWDQILECIENWPLKLQPGPKSSYPITDDIAKTMAKAIFFSFHEWKQCWNTCDVEVFWIVKLKKIEKNKKIPIGVRKKPCIFFPLIWFYISGDLIENSFRKLWLILIIFFKLHAQQTLTNFI